jgi:hypothetical protein
MSKELKPLIIELEQEMKNLKLQGASEKEIRGYEGIKLVELLNYYITKRNF